MATAPKLTVTESRRYLKSKGFVLNSGNRGYLDRIARKLQDQEAAGLPLSLEAARGHAVTPEHPTRRRPLLPVPASRYTDIRRSKYHTMTQPIAGHAQLRPAVVIQSPAVHTRLGRPAAGSVLDTPNKKILVTRSMRTAVAKLRELERATPQGTNAQWRVGFDVYDCTTGREASLFRSPRGHRGRHSEGMTPYQILEEMKARNMSLEEFLVRMELDHYRPRSTLTHICEYVLYADVWPAT